MARGRGFESACIHLLMSHFPFTDHQESFLPNITIFPVEFIKSGSIFLDRCCETLSRLSEPVIIKICKNSV